MGEYNCAALICCPPESEGAIAATAAILMKIGGLDEKTARAAAPAVQKAFDLMPKGSLQHMKDAVVAMHTAKS